MSAERTSRRLRTAATHRLAQARAPHTGRRDRPRAPRRPGGTGGDRSASRKAQMPLNSLLPGLIPSLCVRKKLISSKLISFCSSSTALQNLERNWGSGGQGIIPASESRSAGLRLALDGALFRAPQARPSWSQAPRKGSVCKQCRWGDWTSPLRWRVGEAGRRGASPTPRCARPRAAQHPAVTPATAPPALWAQCPRVRLLVAAQQALSGPGALGFSGAPEICASFEHPEKPLCGDKKTKRR